MPTRGSCLCGAVAYVFESEPKGVFHCHCSRCRKVRGVAHATNMRLPLEGFRFERGEEELVRFKPQDAVRFTHVFCRTCGSSMPNVSTIGVIVPMGSLDDPPPAFTPQHIHVASKASWEPEIVDDLVKHEAGPPL